MFEIWNSSIHNYMIFDNDYSILSSGDLGLLYVTKSSLFYEIQ